FRLEHGVRPLEWDPVLTELARERSADMAERNYFSHDIPGDGYGPEWELSQLSGVIGTGENLGEGDDSNETAMWSLFDAWVASPTHLENLLRPEFNRVGIGVVVVPTWRPDRTIKIVTQVFAIATGPVRRV
ncbi:MAG TPA: CAP domain-containing protein, partial [Chloroflexota bacterium]|nr:CAP domain-containing protein [Chloroflexota bacterium]